MAENQRFQFTQTNDLRQGLNILGNLVSGANGDVPNGIGSLIGNVLRQVTIPGGMAQNPGTPRRAESLSQETRKKLKTVDLDTILDTDRICHICYENYSSRNEGEDDDGYSIGFHTTDPDLVLPLDSVGRSNEGYCCRKEEEGHYPVKLETCGHIFGNGCIVEWLKRSKSCPFCRKEVVEVGNSNNNGGRNRIIRGISGNTRVPANWAGVENLVSDPEFVFAQ